ncbi:MAG TPA: ABC transporter ATP-binding protein [Acidimicrobiia bacterium]
MQATTSQAPLAVETEGLTRTFDGAGGIRGLDLSVPRGSIFGFIGPSGSGKTTTIRLLTGILAPEAGTVKVLGREPVAFDRVARARLGYLPQQTSLYPDLSLSHNLGFAASLFGMPWLGRRQRLREALEFVELADLRRQRLRDVSGGEKRRLALAATLIHSPDLLFLDEPTAGIDPVLRRKFWDRFTQLRDEGRTLFVTTQYVGEAAYCDLVGVLARGRLLLVASPDDLRRHAYGGEVLEVVFASAPSAETIAHLTGATNASRVERIDASRFHLIVEDAGDATGALTGWAAEAEVDFETIEPVLPPFDDVFVELVSRLDVDEEAA